MADGVAPLDLNQILPPDYTSSPASFTSSSTSTAAPHQPLINYSSRKERKDRRQWSEDEHALFLLGVELYGRQWKDISKCAEMTKTRVQLKSHFQKYDEHQQKQRETKGKKKERILDLTLPDFGLDRLDHLIASRPLLKHRLKHKDCPFPFHPDFMAKLRKRIHDTPPPTTPIPSPPPPTEIPDYVKAEKKGTEATAEIKKTTERN